MSVYFVVKLSHISLQNETYLDVIKNVYNGKLTENIFLFTYFCQNKIFGTFLGNKPQKFVLSLV